MKAAISIFLIILTVTIMNLDAANPTKNQNPEYEITVTQKSSKEGVKDKEVGKIVLELYPEIAPKTVHNFDSLVSAKFYDGTVFHRVIPGFMIQGGDPNSKSKPRTTWGTGDPSQTKVPAEFNKLSHTRGVISMARAMDINSASSQFFICQGDASFLDGKYTGFGKVLTGLDIVDAVVNAPRDSNDNPYDRFEMKIKKIK